MMGTLWTHDIITNYPIDKIISISALVYQHDVGSFDYIYTDIVTFAISQDLSAVSGLITVGVDNASILDGDTLKVVIIYKK
jgi:hypothetical protein